MQVRILLATFSLTLLDRMKTLSSSLQVIKEIVDTMFDRDLQLRVHAVLSEAYALERKLQTLRELAQKHKDGEKILKIIED